MDSPAQRDSWNRSWAFLEEHLRPYEDPNHPVDLGNGIFRRGGAGS